MEKEACRERELHGKGTNTLPKWITTQEFNYLIELSTTTRPSGKIFVLCYMRALIQQVLIVNKTCMLKYTLLH